MIFIDRDHNAEELAEQIYQQLSTDYQTIFLRSPLNIPYPLIAKNMAEHIIAKPGSMGILICGTGIGMSIVANKYPGIFANNCKTIKECQWFRKSNNGNVLCLGQNNISIYKALKICRTFLSTDFDIKHQQRIDLISRICNTHRI